MFLFGTYQGLKNFCSRFFGYIEGTIGRRNTLTMKSFAEKGHAG